MPTFDFEALKAAVDELALVFDIQLKRVVFPELVNPMIPHCKAILFLQINFYWQQNYLFMSENG